ncbi:hypothetical protein SprV_0602208100 [Sparganum proliferum]
MKSTRNPTGFHGESAHSGTRESSFPFGQSDEQQTETEDSANCSGTGTLLGEHCCTQKDGQLEEVSTGYTFFLSGRHKAERRGVVDAFTIRNDIAGRRLCLSQTINDRLMSLRLSLQESNFATTISAYVLPMTKLDEAKTKFYEDLHAFLGYVPRTEKMVFIRDSNIGNGTGYSATTVVSFSCELARNITSC